MCLIYRRKDGTAFVRLCYRTGRRGEHRELSPAEIAQWPKGGCLRGRYSAPGRKAPNRLKRLTVTFQMERIDPLAIADMARYMDARHTVDPETQRVTFYAARGISENMIRRAESFGWRKI